MNGALREWTDKETDSGDWEYKDQRIPVKYKFIGEKLSSEKDLNPKETIVDFSVPDSPAFTILGLTPQNVVSPASPRELATTLLNGVDKNGNFQTGIAIDTSLLNLSSKKVTIKKYRKNKMWYRTQLSFATSKGSEDQDEALRLAFGIRFTPLDLGDPRSDKSPLTNCFIKVFEDFGEPPLYEDIEGKIADKYRKEIKVKNPDITDEDLGKKLREEFLQEIKSKADKEYARQLKNMILNLRRSHKARLRIAGLITQMLIGIVHACPSGWHPVG